MNTIKVKKALKQLAKKEGVSVETVRHEIEIAIAEARKNTDPTCDTGPDESYVPVKKMMSPGRAAEGAIGVVWLKIPCAFVRLMGYME